MTSPAPDPTGKRAQLSAARAAFAASVAAAIAAGVLLSSNPTAPPPVVTPPPPITATGCPDTLPGALVIHFASTTASGVTRDTTPPVVVCGPAGMASGFQAHPEGQKSLPPWPNGAPVSGILSPPDTSAFTALSVSPIARGVDSRHWLIPNNSYLASTGLYEAVLPAVLASGIKLDSAQLANFAVPIVETSDTIAGGVLPVWTVTSQLYYRPARGTHDYTDLSQWRNTCHVGSVALFCPPAATADTLGSFALADWYAGWTANIIPQSQTVLDLTLIRSTSRMTPTLVPP